MPLLPPPRGSPPSSSTGDAQRSLWDIVWSCLATIFICTWVSVHPNIPASHDSSLRIALRRLELMFWAVLTPEMVIFWALRQWLGARRLKGMYRDRGWTMTHGYFVQMGGFMLMKGEREEDGILCPVRLHKLQLKSLIDFPSINEKEIQDKSKGDGLSKGLATGQTSWFIAQCISRKYQGLGITGIELVTLAFAVLNGVVYFLWWNKPLDIRCYVPVYLKCRPTNVTEDACSGNSKSIETLGLDESNVRYLIKKWVLAIFHRLSDMRHFESVFCFSPIQEGSKAIPTFYAYWCSGSVSEILVCQTLISIMGMIFGAIHCIGWSFSFPSKIETLLRRISALVITIVPCFALFFNFFAPFRIPMLNHVAKAFWILFLIFLPAYILARIALLVGAFIALRDLPSGTYSVVQWTSFLPHL